jgi:hypothetical protein
MAKEDSLLLPPELVQVPDRRCSSSLMCARALFLPLTFASLFRSYISSSPFEGSSVIANMHYNDRIEYLKAQVRTCDSCTLSWLFHLPHVS